MDINLAVRIIYNHILSQRQDNVMNLIRYLRAATTRIGCRYLNQQPSPPTPCIALLLSVNVILPPGISPVYFNLLINQGIFGHSKKRLPVFFAV
jgi:hypothetical protein